MRELQAQAGWNENRTLMAEKTLHAMPSRKFMHFKNEVFLSTLRCGNSILTIIVRAASAMNFKLPCVTLML